MVFGNTSGIVSDTGVQRLRSGSQIPAASRVAIARKAAGFFGNGLNFWAYVHVDDGMDSPLRINPTLLTSIAQSRISISSFLTSCSHLTQKERATEKRDITSSRPAIYSKPTSPRLLGKNSSELVQYHHPSLSPIPRTTSQSSLVYVPFGKTIFSSVLMHSPSALVGSVCCELLRKRRPSS